MLYYIIPPIIIIASISVLIWFLFRKATLIPQDAVLIPQQENFYSAKIKGFFGAIGHFFLGFAEAIIRRAKLTSLKFHNTSNEWAQTIRKKRERAKIEKEDRLNALSALKDVGNVDERQDVHQGEESDVVTFVRQRRMRRAQPMVSDSVTMPEKHGEKENAKEKLEDVLIKRIAMNPRDIEAYERLGDYYMQQENAKDALECYRQVLKLSPAHSKAKMKIRRLEGLLSRK